MLPPSPSCALLKQFYQEAFALDDFELRENDYVIGSRKCGGNAQYIQKNRFVCHTTFLWDYSKERMNSLLIPKKIPLYRQNRSHEAFLCCLKEYFSSKEHLLETIPPALSKHYTLKEAPPINTLLSTDHRRATQFLDDPWNTRKTDVSRFPKGL